MLSLEGPPALGVLYPNRSLAFCRNESKARKTGLPVRRRWQFTSNWETASDDLTSARNAPQRVAWQVDDTDSRCQPRPPQARCMGGAPRRAMDNERRPRGRAPTREPWAEIVKRRD